MKRGTEKKEVKGERKKIGRKKKRRRQERKQGGGKTGRKILN